MPSTTQYLVAFDGSVNGAVRTAFVHTHDGFSPDRVVADPVVNGKFLEICASLVGELAPVEFNRRLINLRKMGLLADVKATKRTSFRDEHMYRHGSEIAIRHLEKRDAITLDDIICDPERAKEFDSIAETISPGHLSLQYRWAALNLRKSRRLTPELMSHVVKPIGVLLGRLQDLDLTHVPAAQGLYVFYSANQTLYIGEAGNLRVRLGKHTDHSDNKELARWFWKHGFKDVTLEIQELPSTTSKKVRCALEAELIGSRRPLFNVQRVKPPATNYRRPNR